jgi:AcrR family transcriptional regulator
MLDEGYAAVSSRRVAKDAGVNVALVYYYFATMDDLFVELFRRGADRSLGRLVETLDDRQPLWRLWELTHDFSNNALTMEFIALANHRKPLKAEISTYSRKFRQLQLERLTPILEGYGVDLARWPATSLILLMAGISRFLLIEESFDVDIGHADTVAIIERQIGDLEGERPTQNTNEQDTA